MKKIRSLNVEFEMKDFGHSKRIHRMDIISKRPKRLLILKQTSYVKIVLSKSAILNSNMLYYFLLIISNTVKINAQ